VIERLISPTECAGLAALYPNDALFRSRVVMAKHGFGPQISFLRLRTRESWVQILPGAKFLSRHRAVGALHASRFLFERHRGEAPGNRIQVPSAGAVARYR
jgi:hypothetical protein